MLSTAVPTSFPLPFGSSAGVGYIRTIPTASQISITPGAASLTDGFPPSNSVDPLLGGTPPSIQDFNGITNEITAAIQWMQAGGMPMYNATFQTAIGGYPNGAAIMNTNNTGFWISTVDNNLTNPNTGGAGWKPLLNSYLDKSVAGAVDVTLTTLESVYSMIDTTGAITANINVIVPSVPGSWTFNNSTTGLFSVTVKTAAGTGIVVPKGLSATLWSDGVNVYSSSGGVASLVANGYWQSPSGLILQWGNPNATAASFPVTFPVTFPTAVFALTFGNNESRYGYYNNVLTTSGFQYSNWNLPTGVAVYPDVFTYIAVGY
jgi:hypothetical protein